MPEFPYPAPVGSAYDLPPQEGVAVGQFGLLQQLRKRANQDGPDVCADYGAIATAPDDTSQASWNTERVQAALDENEYVKIAGGNVVVDEVTIGRQFGRLDVHDNAGLHGSGEDVDLLTIEGNYGSVSGVLIGHSGTRAMVRTTGFRTLLDDVTLTGESANGLVVAALETQTFMGRFSGATGAGVLYDSDEGDAVADLCMIGTYLQNNGIGLDAVNAGSIDAIGVHSESNEFFGFRTSGASASRFSHCYADSNGWDGWSIADTTYGMTFHSCWGFRSCSQQNGRADWRFTNVHNIHLFGCESSGDPRNGGVKGASFAHFGTNDITYWGCKAGAVTSGSGSPSGVSDRTRMHGCTGLLLPYNTSPGGGRSYTGTTLASGAGAAFSIAIDTLVPSLSQSVRSFLVTATWRATDNNPKGTGLFLVTHDVGISGGVDVTTLNASGVTLSAVGMTDLTHCASLDFTATNTAGESIQVAFDVKDLGSTRGFAF